MADPVSEYSQSKSTESLVYLVVYIAVSDMEMKREADSNDITECCSLDYKPTVCMFAVFLKLFVSVSCFNIIFVLTDWLS